MHTSETEYCLTNWAVCKHRTNHFEVAVLSAKLYVLVSKYLHRRGRINSCGSWEATDGAGSSFDDCVSSSWPDESFMVSSWNIKKQRGGELQLVREKHYLGSIFSKIVNTPNQIAIVYLASSGCCTGCSLSTPSHNKDVSTWCSLLTTILSRSDLALEL